MPANKEKWCINFSEAARRVAVAVEVRFDEKPYLIGNAELWTVESGSLMGPQYDQALTRLRKLN